MFDAERFSSGDERYVREVVKRYSPIVLLVCRSYATDGDHLEDLYQETWQAVHAKARALRGDGSFEAWLYRVATNVSVSDFRSRKSASDAMSRLLLDPPAPAATPDPLLESQRRELEQAIRGTLPELPTKERQALTLRVLEGRRAREVAEVMGIDPATVRSHVRHALIRLRRIMEDPASELSRYRTDY